MKVSAFEPSSTSTTFPTSPPWPIAAAAIAYLAAHLPFLAPSLEDIDSINFALALRDFDPASHQPHPPGYPVYVGLGRASLAVINTVAPSLEVTRAEALALAIWSALAGAVAIVAAWFVLSALDQMRRGGEVVPRGAAGEVAGVGPLWAAMLLAVAPLFWMTGLRPMSDMPGLAAALSAQALLLRAMQGRGWLVAAALVTGFAAGLRSQSVVLTVPLLAWAAFANRRSGWPTLARSALALLAGGLVWGVPLVAAAGGLEGYLRALGSQAGEDFGWVNMLWSNPSPRRLAFGLYETFVLPWASVPLAVLIGLLAVLGGGIMLVRERRALAVLCVAFGPYLAFHLLFQETPFVRYALPVLPAIVWLTARALAAAPRFGRPIGLVLVASAALVGVPAGIGYGSERHPAFRAIDDMARRQADAAPAAVYSHFSLFRPLQASVLVPLEIVPPVRNYEWLGPVEYWRTGGDMEVWFFADPRRTDLALIDPQSRLSRVQYRWSVADRPELGGTRPLGVDWYRLDPPGWFASQGWSLTAETGGIVRATARGLDHGPIDAYVRRRSGPLTVMIGGRHLGGADDPATALTVSLDGTDVDSWTFDHHSSGPNFLRFLQLPDGTPAGPGKYARLTVGARASVPGRPTPEVAIRQFDVQSPDKPILGFGEGWHEAEYDVSAGQAWRWTSDRSVLRVISERAVVVTIRGESPLRYFDAPPTVRFKAGDQVIGEFRPEADFEWRVPVPADVLAGGKGAIAIETDRVYLPGQAEGTADTRRLGLRIYDLLAEPAAD